MPVVSAVIRAYQNTVLSNRHLLRKHYKITASTKTLPIIIARNSRGCPPRDPSSCSAWGNSLTPPRKNSTVPHQHLVSAFLAAPRKCLVSSADEAPRLCRVSTSSTPHQHLTHQRLISTSTAPPQQRLSSTSAAPHQHLDSASSAPQHAAPAHQRLVSTSPAPHQHLTGQRLIISASSAPQRQHV
eukprot:1180215-Prorocentrum_minimum.AAC.7